MSDVIVVARSAPEYDVFGLLIRDYWEWLRSRYPMTIDAVGAHQGLEEELQNLSTVYGPPNGKTLLALRDGQVIGAVAYRDLGDGSCEMKRLFVQEQAQGQGTGHKLCETLMAQATIDGFQLMRLDTGGQNTEALAMYAALGFRPCPPYHDYPEDLMFQMVFMEKRLGGEN